MYIATQYNFLQGGYFYFVITIGNFKVFSSPFFIDWIGCPTAHGLLKPHGQNIGLPTRRGAKTYLRPQAGNWALGKPRITNTEGDVSSSCPDWPVRGKEIWRRPKFKCNLVFIYVYYVVNFADLGFKWRCSLNASSVTWRHNFVAFDHTASLDHHTAGQNNHLSMNL